MNTIEFYDGRKWEFDEYGSFCDACDVLCSCGSGYVSYYDTDGDTHVCEFAVVRGGLMCLGELIAITDGKDVFDFTGKHFDSRIYELAGKLVRFEKDDFVGWSL